jgi:[acyl-carrier-protein] S-malonyltransferase
MKAFIFPGQGAQFKGMGHDLYLQSPKAKELFEKANEMLGFDIAKTMFEGTDEELKQTNVTQPAVFLHSVISFLVLNTEIPDMVAGHSLGEFSALVANQTLRFEDALTLVSLRAKAMQQACEQTPSTMAAVLKFSDETQIEDICNAITNEVVVAANYNCPGQLVISGSVAGIDLAIEKMKEAGVGRAIKLAVGGAFHSPLMAPAQAQLAEAIASIHFSTPICPVYQNVNGLPAIAPSIIQQNLNAQLTAPVRWSQSVQKMIYDGATKFVECGPGNVLQGLVSKVDSKVEVAKLG